MINWDTLSQWKNKAGDISSKMKGFAKDLITVDDDEQMNEFNPVIVRASSCSPTQQSSIELPRLECNLQDIIRQINQLTTEGSMRIMVKFTEKNSIEVGESADQVEEYQQILQETCQSQNVILQQFYSQCKENIHQLQELLIKGEQDDQQQDVIQEICCIVNTFFNSIQRNSVFYERFQQMRINKATQRDYINLIDKSFVNTANEIQSLKQDMQNKDKSSDSAKKEQALSNDNLQLQRKLAECQEKLQALQQQIKELQQKNKDYEKQSQGWDKTKRDYIEEIKQNYNEIESLKSRIKQKEQDMAANTQEMQKYYEVRQKLDQKDEEIDRLTLLLEEWQQENQQLQHGIQSIQLLLDSEKEKNEIFSRKYEQEMKRMRQEVDREDISQLKKIRDQSDNLKQENAKLKYELEDLSIQYKLLTQKQKDIEQESHALINKVRQDQVYQSNLIDRRVVANCLISYLDYAADFNVKMQILESLSSLLNLSADEKEKICFFKGNKQTPTKQGQPGNLKDKFIGFLMNGE